MKIAVVGMGYVGLSNAILLSQQNHVVILDILQDKVDMVNSGLSPIQDFEIQEYLQTGNLNLKATTNKMEAYENAKFIIIAVPTDYKPEFAFFDMSQIEQVLEDIIAINPHATVVIKSTVPIGFTKGIKQKYGLQNVLFSPEFLREGQALKDNLYPSRIIVSGNKDKAAEFGQILKNASIKKDAELLVMNTTEAEAVKLFSNTYLAMRVAFFNEIDSYAIIKNLNTLDIIKGVCLDPRIATGYNNPSFGYGGYCLPKDTKQIMASYADVPHKLITAVVESNQTRKDMMTEYIAHQKPQLTGIYRLAMKKNSENFRNSAILDIIQNLSNRGFDIVIYEKNIRENTFLGFRVMKDLNEFKRISDIIVANRMEKELDSVRHKVFTRDIFGNDG